MASVALGEQKYLFKSKTDKINVSNATFTMAKLMSAVLMGCFVLTASKQFFGDPIRCHKDSPVPSVQVFESHCFMEETYTIASNKCNNKDFYDRTIHDCNSFKAQKAHLYEDTVFHSYYRWVPHVLLLQAIICYLPWYFWQQAEGGKVRKLLAGLSTDPLTKTSVEAQVASLGDFLLNHRGWFNTAALKLLLCQTASFLFSLGQLFIIDLFLGRRFLSLGSNIFSYTKLRVALVEAFPRVVMCSMDHYGMTDATDVTISGFCTLPLNIVNEKIYLVLWFVFLAHAILSMLQLIRQASLLVISFRSFLTPSLTSSKITQHQLRQLLLKATFGDTVLLQLIAANCDSSQFAALVQLLAKEEGLDGSYVSQELASLVTEKESLQESLF